MENNVKPGDEAIIIDSAVGKNGKTVGRKVKVHAYNPEAPEGLRTLGEKGWVDMHNGLNDPRHYCPDTPYEKHHTVHGLIWPCTCLDGQPFIDVHGREQMVIDVADKWLRKLTKTETKNTETASDELKVD